MPITAAVLMCHAPIVIPAIAGPRASQCAGTTAAMQEAARHVAATRPGVVVVVSPHAPRRPGAWGVVAAPALNGDFARFGQPGVRVALPGAPAAARAVVQAADLRGLSTWAPPGDGLDHGATVPLHFIAAAGYDGPTLLVSLPGPATGSEARFGEVLAAAAVADGRDWVVVASGDMSHRLRPDAPAGFHPRARAFDDAFVAALREGRSKDACALDPELRGLAAEDVVDSTTVALGALDFTATGRRVLDYAAPFGVGYAVAVLADLRGGADGGLLALARATLAAHLGDGAAPSQARVPAAARASSGVFVTLRGADGALRGCIGHMAAQHARLGDEVADCAVLAATRDPRFAPVTAADLRGLSIEISLLGPTERVADHGALDPARYGVEVSHAGRRGVLLPGVEGVDSAARQVAIACDKAGLSPDGPMQLARFEVTKFREA